MVNSSSLRGLSSRVLLSGIAAAVVAALTIVNVGCGDSGTGGEGGGADCTDVKGYAELGTAISKCTNCHSSELTTPTERQSAPEGFDYDTYELAKQHPDEIAEQLEEGLMPPSGSPTLTDTEKSDLIKWASCGTPE
ncbi:MAG: hypothetical protein HOW73_35975 [Polyangiaceae bacterium]|nr:hypothetical protein [Polyangiaceae bacterium]